MTKGDQVSGDIEGVRARLAQIVEDRQDARLTFSERVDVRKLLADHSRLLERVDELEAERDEAREISRVFTRFYPFGEVLHRDERLRDALCAVPSPASRAANTQASASGKAEVAAQVVQPIRDEPNSSANTEG